ncbi:galactokinase [Micractinium conductrix]|uniref:Galactokinase n=1 Tax=Micractinium conductrix TaxID=554055 RepID=A0A2P6VSI2_9CHLO|nr:galactokinase [Micractinium conductrix]|eukprot:PSC77056.1 galactokinase [Micractinium conductrix]
MEEPGPSSKAARGQRWRPEGATLDSLPPDTVERILELGWLPPTPLYDRGDLLRDAAALACVGNSACTDLASRLFEQLSPRLGLDLPGGATESSKVAQLKAACKEWGLAVGGSKPEIWQRVLDQVQDSVEDEDGQPPKHCIVSGATRGELAGWRDRRISLAKAKDIFNLWKHEVETCNCILDANGAGGRPGHPIKALYLLEDVKRKARARHGTWEKLTGKKAESRAHLEQFKQEYDQKKQERVAALRAELRARGHSVAQVESLMSSPGVSFVTWGSSRELAVGPAVDWIERMQYCISSEQREEEFALAFMYCDYRPPRSEAQYKTREEKLKRAANRCMRSWAQNEWVTLQQLRDDADVPRSLLPELERLWGEANPQNG